MSYLNFTISIIYIYFNSSFLRYDRNDNNNLRLIHLMEMNIYIFNNIFLYLNHNRFLVNIYMCTIYVSK